MLNIGYYKALLWRWRYPTSGTACRLLPWSPWRYSTYYFHLHGSCYSRGSIFLASWANVVMNLNINGWQVNRSGELLVITNVIHFLFFKRTSSFSSRFFLKKFERTFVSNQGFFKFNWTSSAVPNLIFHMSRSQFLILKFFSRQVSFQSGFSLPYVRLILKLKISSY